MNATIPQKSIRTAVYMNRLRNLYTHTRDIVAEVGKTSVKYNIPIYYDSISGKVLNVHKNHSYLIVEIERVEPKPVVRAEEPPPDTIKLE